MRKLGFRLATVTAPSEARRKIVVFDVESGEEIGGITNVSLHYPASGAITAEVAVLVEDLREGFIEELR